jgi:transcriptional regulator with XRE-family HTH domain
MSEFGSRLRTARKYAKLTQVQLARAAGIRQSSLSEAERSADGSAYTSQLAKSCGVDAHWLATGEGEMKPSNATPNVRFSSMIKVNSDSDEPIARALRLLDKHLNELVPVLQSAGREVLRKWVLGEATTEEAAKSLDVMSMVSDQMGQQQEDDFPGSPP